MKSKISKKKNKAAIIGSFLILIKTLKGNCIVNVEQRTPVAEVAEVTVVMEVLLRRLFVVN